MRLPRVRIGLRSLMLLVAVAALLGWLEVRRRRFADLAEHHASHELGFGGISGNQRGMHGYDVRGRPITDWEHDRHWQLAARYRRAARRPWLPVPPDPPAAAYRDEYRARRLAGHSIFDWPVLPIEPWPPRDRAATRGSGRSSRSPAGRPACYNRARKRGNTGHGTSSRTRT